MARNLPLLLLVGCLFPLAFHAAVLEVACLPQETVSGGGGGGSVASHLDKRGWFRAPRAPHDRALVPGDDVGEMIATAEVAALAYCNDSARLAEFACAACGYDRAAFRVVSVLEEGSARAMVAVQPARNRVVVAFRGTVCRADWDVNWDMRLAPYALRAVPDRAWRAIAAAGLGGAAAEVRAHRGFLRRYRTLRRMLRRCINETLAARPGAAVRFLGHSMGGALATIAALDIVPRLPNGTQVDLFTFGAPRVGNRAFSVTINAIVPEIYRFVEENDPIPHAPLRNLGYHHTKGQRYATRMASAAPLGTLSGMDVEQAGSEDGPEGSKSRRGSVGDDYVGGATFRVYSCDGGDGEDGQCANARWPYLDRSAHKTVLGVQMFGRRTCTLSSPYSRSPDPTAKVELVVEPRHVWLPTKADLRQFKQLSEAAPAA